MKINFSLEVVLYLTAITLGLFSAITLLFSQKNKLANILLALLILSISGWILDAFFRVSGLYRQNPHLYFLPIYYSLGFGPLIYFYVQSLTLKNFRFQPKDFLHFLPVLIQAIFYLIISTKDYQTKYHVWFEIHQPYTYRIEYDGTWLSLVIYLILSLIYLHRYRTWIKNSYSNIFSKMLNWLYILLILQVFVCLSWLVEAILRDFRNTYYQYDFSTNLLSATVYCMGILGILQSNVEANYSDELFSKSKKLPHQNLDLTLIRQIEELMLEQKPYLNPDLTLADFSQAFGQPPKTISYQINQHFQKPFNTFVNTYRVEEVKRRLAGKDLEKLTLLGIAYESGFNSKTTFNRIFKEFTGLSPTEFLKK